LAHFHSVYHAHILEICNRLLEIGQKFCNKWVKKLLNIMVSRGLIWSTKRNGMSAENNRSYCDNEQYQDRFILNTFREWRGNEFWILVLETYRYWKIAPADFQSLNQGVWCRSGIWILKCFIVISAIYWWWMLANICCRWLEKSVDLCYLTSGRPDSWFSIFIYTIRRIVIIFW